MAEDSSGVTVGSMGVTDGTKDEFNGVVDDWTGVTVDSTKVTDGIIDDSTGVDDGTMGVNVGSTGVTDGCTRVTLDEGGVTDGTPGYEEPIELATDDGTTELATDEGTTEVATDEGRFGMLVEGAGGVAEETLPGVVPMIGGNDELGTTLGIVLPVLETGPLDGSCEEGTESVLDLADDEGLEGCVFNVVPGGDTGGDEDFEDFGLDTEEGFIVGTEEDIGVVLGVLGSVLDDFGTLIVTFQGN